MNYYEHHIGDYAAATAHLSLIEDAIYSRMLRRYYLQEGPLPAPVEQVARLIGARGEEETVRAILLEFFTLADDGWHQKRADEDIERVRVKRKKAADSANARWDAENVKRECERNANASEAHGERNALQSPVTSHQSPSKSKREGAGSRLPTDWIVPADWRVWAKSERPDLDPDREAAKFADHWRAQPGAKGRRSDWQATWRNWIRNAFVPRSHGPPQGQQQSKTLGAIHQLEEMKRGLAGNRNPDGLPETALLGFGPDPGD